MTARLTKEGCYTILSRHQTQAIQHISMKSHLIPILALGLLVTGAMAQDKPDLTNPQQKTSYAIGVNVVLDRKSVV